ncbi:hypothetical protein CG51_16270 [Haematobacter missouriensis]|uniref:Uncharacterized protein n=1 Tax=Haematobacter missouriensis TaxID=366616 RepID=A0A212AYI1_9RHOB|nr:hypothetical protein [Haematobacter missouriensis]KFI33108.1 hypothetical protein CG51_16270 [Haematobacter missouriensis]OWJ79788.1 hypothetical protein CDV53_00475 [Haematobacter missouriensis]OWJ86539.1 hypothetical protein CDV52_00850 [Haematobacter missouriensis]
MNEIADLERRITTALERLRRGMEDIPTPDMDGDGALRAALVAEEERNRTLEARADAIRSEQEALVAELERRVADLAGALDLATEEMGRLRNVNAALSEAMRELREARDPEASVLNRALLAEAEELRSRRAADLAQVEEILEELRPLIGEPTDA